MIIFGPWKIVNIVLIILKKIRKGVEENCYEPGVSLL